MDRRELLGAAAAAAISPIFPADASSRTKPNFIVIYCDDMGYGDIGPNGNTKIPTPNLDRLAREGTVLTEYYAPANLCTPSRAGLLTGRYPIRAGQALMLVPGSHNGLPHDNPTIPNVLKAAGYKSCQVGKWHLGSEGDFFPPTKYGYDYFFGIPYSHDMWPLSLFEARSDQAEVRQMRPDPYTLQEQFYLHAEAFIEEHAKAPFFVNMSFSAPHLPSWVPSEFRGRSSAGDYGDTIVQIDSFVGRLLAKLEALRLADHTLIMFTSDNGPWYWGSNGPFRDRKSQPGYDGGYRVPFVAWMPGVVRPGQKVSGLASGIDILPTLCAFADVPLPSNVIFDGVDVSGMLTKGLPSPRSEIFLFMDEDLVGMRTPRWKYIENKTFSANTPSPDRYGYRELYEPLNDVGENYNVASLFPDVTAELHSKFEVARALFDTMRTIPRKVEPPIHFLGDPRPIWND